jgi:signal transduction histidine kinase
MNRLWVRMSLAFAAVILIVSMVGGFMATISMQPGFGSDTAVPPEVQAYLEQLRENRDPWFGPPMVIVVGIIAAAAGIWMSRRITAPLAELEEAAAAIGQQDLNYRVTVQGSQELVTVATAFNDMATQLEQAETLRSKLLADVAHELRHPIHLLQGNLQAILDDVYPLDKEEIARLSDQTRHLAVLVNDLHILAQAEAKQLPLVKSKIDVAALVKETASDFKPLAAEREVSIQVELLGTLPALNVDAARLRQAVHNLLDNALQHTPQGGIITVSVEQIQGAFQIRVQDTGEGIAPEQLSQIFDRYYRGDGARSWDKGGTGLGLAIVKAIIETHWGTVTATSPGVDQGTTFTISLPYDISSKR